MHVPTIHVDVVRCVALCRLCSNACPERRHSVDSETVESVGEMRQCRFLVHHLRRCSRSELVRAVRAAAARLLEAYLQLLLRRRTAPEISQVALVDELLLLILVGACG